MTNPQEGSGVYEENGFTDFRREWLTTATDEQKAEWFAMREKAVPLFDVADNVRQGTVAGDSYFSCCAGDVYTIVQTMDALGSEAEGWRSVGQDLEKKNAKMGDDYSALLRVYNELKMQYSDLETIIAEKNEAIARRDEAIARLADANSTSRNFEPVKVRMAGVIITLEADNA